MSNSPSLVLTRVCRRWRTIAIADPWLWKDLYLDASDCNLDKLCLLLRYWLGPATPLMLHLDLNPKLTILPGINETTIITKTVFPRYDDAIPTLRTVLPASRTLELFVADDERHAAYSSTIKSLLEKNKLEQTGTICIPKLYTTLHDFPGLPAEEKVRDFLKSAALDTTNLSLSFFGLQLPKPCTRLTLPSLQALILNAHHANSTIRELLQSLSLPSLTFLHIRGGNLNVTSFDFRHLVYLELMHVDIHFQPALDQLWNLESMFLLNCPGVELVVGRLLGTTVLQAGFQWLCDNHCLKAGLNHNHANDFRCPRLNSLQIGSGPNRALQDLLVRLTLSRGMISRPVLGDKRHPIPPHALKQVSWLIVGAQSLPFGDLWFMEICGVDIHT